jgi:hypothetical protein
LPPKNFLPDRIPASGMHLHAHRENISIDCKPVRTA